MRRPSGLDSGVQGAPTIEQLNCRVSSENPSWHLFTYSEACSAYSDAFFMYNCKIEQLIGFQVRSLRGTFYVLRSILRVFRRMLCVFKGNCNIEQQIGFQVKSLRGTGLRTPKR